MSSTPCRTCAETRDTPDLTCPFCGIADRPGATKLREHRQTSETMPDARCETCGSERESIDGICPSCERAKERTKVNEESAGPLVVPFILLWSAGLAFLLKLFPFLNSMPEFEWEDLVPPHFLNPWLFIVGSVVTVWSISVLVMMQNDRDRWTDRSKTRSTIRNHSWIQIVVGIVLIVIAYTT